MGLISWKRKTYKYGKGFSRIEFTRKKDIIDVSKSPTSVFITKRKGKYGYYDGVGKSFTSKRDASKYLSDMKAGKHPKKVIPYSA